MTWWWVTTVVLVIGVAVLGRSFIAERRQGREALARLSEEADARRAEETRAASAAQIHALAARQAEHDREVASLRARADAAEEAAAKTRDEMRRGMKWEAVSHRALLTACEQLGVDGALVTNVVFVPVTSDRESFVAQVDHVLLLDNGALVVEAKYWKGLVFDGLRPSAVHPSLANLVDESSLRPPFAIQVASAGSPLGKADEAWWQVRVAAGEKSPCTQVRTQARRLSDLVKHRLGISLWFSTCVYYSHATKSAHVDPVNRSAGGATTAVVTDASGLRRAIDEVRGRRSTALQPGAVEELIAFFTTQGAQVDRVGRYAKPRGSRE